MGKWNVHRSEPALHALMFLLSSSMQGRPALPSSPSSPYYGHFNGSREEQYPMLPSDETLNKYSPIPNRPRRRYLYLGCIGLAITSTLGYFALSVSRTTPAEIVQEPGVEKAIPKVDLLDPSLYLNGPPTRSFRENLRPDAKYITSWISAGWTNDVMTYINLIYLAKITDRIPIIPMFTPSHIGGDKPTIDFGEVFDVKRLSQGTGIPVLEWNQVKNRSSDALDELGCWNTWESVQDHEAYPRRSVVPNYLKLVIPHFEHDRHAYFWALASLAFPEGRQENLKPPLASPTHHVLLPPDEQLLCYDYLYYVCAHQPFEFEFDYSPAWRYVGQYLRWTPRLEAIADSYVRRTLGTPEGSPTPPVSTSSSSDDSQPDTQKYIGIHVRHGDFKNWCGQVPIADCFASIPILARRIDEIKTELRESRGMTVDHVIMTSDERDESWWQQVAEQGWYKVDHSGTAERYNAWYPVLIDAVIQSGGVGFLGTDRSTMSILARRRVQSWRNEDLDYFA
ncbi:hypothetical protein NP233_g5974 [Leucocoprinus birnbaumii]|uniref:GDP-fucose protein O-fucosyltransferase 2 n=1 Tax=Leucocoprinus birnbaumii TaxID=56174 RepID=A0AAD5VU63_9AGAR|nr:hypothetical protein NP233_g5974 [Leucocoprinus birnbaumii]